MICELFNQFFAYSAIIVLGFQLDWSPISPNNSTLVTNEVSWITKIFFIGKLVGYVILVPSRCKLSNKVIASLGSVLLGVSWVVVGFSHSINQVIIGRFIGGIADTITYCALLTYLVEKSSALIAKIVIGLQPFLLLIGSMFPKIIGMYTSCTTTCLLSAVITLTVFTLLLLILDHSTNLEKEDKSEDEIEAIEEINDLKMKLKEFIVHVGIVLLYVILAVASIAAAQFIYKEPDVVPLLFQFTVYLVIQIISLEIFVINIEETSRRYLGFICFVVLIAATVVGQIYIWSSNLIFLGTAIMVAISINLGLQTVPSITNKFFTLKVKNIKIGMCEIYVCLGVLIASNIFDLFVKQYAITLASLVIVIFSMIVLIILSVMLNAENIKDNRNSSYHMVSVEDGNSNKNCSILQTQPITVTDSFPV